MSVAIIGRTSIANFMVTDAMAMIKADTISFRDCLLRDKISKLNTSFTYCTILGDEYLLWGIQNLDLWANEKHVKIDFKKEETIQQVIDITERILMMQNFEKKETLPFQDTSTLYFIDKDSVVEYILAKNGNKYALISRNEFADNSVFINYGGYKEKIDFQIKLDGSFEDVINVIENFHDERKKNPFVNGRKLLLPYDFDNRFSGVLIQPNENVKSIIPFRSISEMLASRYRYVWALIDDPKFFYEPFK